MTLVAAAGVGGGSRSDALPGDPLATFGAGGVLRVPAPVGCGPCPSATTDLGEVVLETNGAKTVFGYEYAVPSESVDGRPVLAAAVALVEGGALRWRAPVTSAGTRLDHRLLAAGVETGTGQVVVVVGITQQGVDDDDPDVLVRQEIRRYSTSGALLSTAALPAAPHGEWTLAAVAADGSVVGVTEATTTDELPVTTVRRYSAAGSLRWTRTLPTGDSAEAVDVGSTGQVVLAGTRAVLAELSFDGLAVGLTDAGALDPAFGTSGRFVSLAPSGFGRAFTEVDVVGSDVALVGLDQWEAEDEYDDATPGAALVVRLRSGQPWTAFSGDGLREQRWSGPDGMRVVLADVLIDGDRTVTAGTATEPGAFRATIALQRITPAGTLDPTFSVDPAAATELMGLAPVAGGYVSASPPSVEGGTWGFPLRAFAASGSTTTGPAAATAVRITTAGARTATVAWTPPPGSITGYELELDLGADGAVDAMVPITPRSSTPFSGLPPDRLVAFALRSRSAQGLGPRSGWSSPTVPPFRTVDAFTDRQLRDFAGRAATAAELAAWRTAVLGGERPSGRISRAVDFSAWSPVRSPIVRLYQAYFLRLPDTPGLEYWVGRYRAGASLSTISSGFAGSNEFRQRYGTLTNRQFVERIYLNILGRPGEASGVTFWTGELDSSRRSRGSVMIGFSESLEYKRTAQPLVDVVNIYSGMLRRVPTADERQLWVPLLTLGQPRTVVIAHLLGSAEYDARIPA